MHRKPMIVAISAVFLASGEVHADAPPRDSAVGRGEHVARLVCSACHSVADDQEFPPLMNPPAPSFRDIANRSTTSVRTVKRFVLTTHWDPPREMPMRMPSPMLMSADADEVARYLMSLRKP